MDERVRQKGKVGPVYRMFKHMSVAVLDTCYERLKRKTYLVSGKRERWYCLVISMPELVKRQMMMM